MNLELIEGMVRNSVSRYDPESVVVMRRPESVADGPVAAIMVLFWRRDGVSSVHLALRSFECIQQKVELLRILCACKTGRVVYPHQVVACEAFGLDDKGRSLGEITNVRMNAHGDDFVFELGGSLWAKLSDGSGIGWKNEINNHKGGR